MKIQNIIGKVLCTFVVLVLLTNNVYALTKDIVLGANVIDSRTVFESDGGESPNVYVDFNLKDYGNIRYISLDGMIRNTAPYNTNANMNLSRESLTVEQQDRYNYKNVYFSVWNASKKLRVNGHDCQLKYPAIFVSEGEWDFIAGEPASMVFLSKDDMAALYGYDINYWGEKNTYYFKRNGKGYLQTCTAENAPKASASTSSGGNTAASKPAVKYTCYSGSKIPDFGALTGRSGTKNMRGSMQGFAEQYTYYNVTSKDVSSYASALQASGFSGSNMDVGMGTYLGMFEGTMEMYHINIMAEMEH